MAGAFGAFTQSRLATFHLRRVRQGSPPGPSGQGSLMSHEELATIFHPPTASVAAERMQTTEFTELEPPAKFYWGSEPGAVTVGRVLFRGDDRRIGIDEDARRRHLYIVGSTGAGKSTLLLNLIHQDMLAGRGLTVIDPGAPGEIWPMPQSDLSPSTEQTTRSSSRLPHSTSSRSTRSRVPTQAASIKSRRASCPHSRSSTIRGDRGSKICCGPPCSQRSSSRAHRSIPARRDSPTSCTAIALYCGCPITLSVRSGLANSRRGMLSTGPKQYLQSPTN